MTESVDLPRAPEIKTYPVKEVGHMVADLFDLYYKFGQVTRERFVGNTGKKEGVERSLWARMERAQLLKKLKRGEVSLEQVNLEKRKIDEIDIQFTKQKNIDIEIPGLGFQSVYYADINLPDHLKSPEDMDKPPVFLIPAWSGDLYGVEPLIKELAMKGRRVVSLAYPESWLGKTTEEFALAGESTSTYQPHTAFFKEAINRLLGENNELGLWGYSTGGSIAAEILADPQFQKKVESAVLIAPPNLVEQSKLSLYSGIAREMEKLLRLKHGWKTSDISIVLSSKTPVEKENSVRRKRISKSLMDKVVRYRDIWKNAQTKNGKIILVSGGRDEITKSGRGLDAFLNLNQYAVVNYKKASHLTFLTRAKSLVGRLLEIQNQAEGEHSLEI